MVPGLALASATNSFSVFAGTPALIAIICGASPIAATGSRSLSASSGNAFCTNGLITSCPESTTPSV